MKSGFINHSCREIENCSSISVISSGLSSQKGYSFSKNT
ncbi:hypothetical protein HMPREF9124_0521 [Oribacterium sp. oral taxon 108 str. F0425]|nr:hypothetical protein HMPREF9124_0521 [Oribacterium sp. oral taxon 108 str. F0425]